MENVEKSVENIVENLDIGSEEVENMDVNEDDWLQGWNEAEKII